MRAVCTLLAVAGGCALILAVTLDLASEQLVHRRVAAVLTFLRGAILRPPG